MKYRYSFTYKNLESGEVVENAVSSNKAIAHDALFLKKFIDYTETRLGDSLSWEGESDSFPKSTSELRGDSASNFQKMEFELTGVLLEDSSTLQVDRFSW
jgi:hypothetical protein